MVRKVGHHHQRWREVLRAGAVFKLPKLVNREITPVVFIRLSFWFGGGVEIHKNQPVQIGRLLERIHHKGDELTQILSMVRLGMRLADLTFDPERFSCGRVGGHKLPVTLRSVGFIGPLESEASSQKKAGYPQLIACAYKLIPMAKAMKKAVPCWSVWSAFGVVIQEIKIVCQAQVSSGHAHGGHAGYFATTGAVLFLEIAQLLIPLNNGVAIFFRLRHLRIAPFLSKYCLDMAVEEVRERLPPSGDEIATHGYKPATAEIGGNNGMPFALLTCSLKLLSLDLLEPSLD